MATERPPSGSAAPKSRASQAEPALSTRSHLVISYSVNSLAVNAGWVSLGMFTNAPR